MSLTKEQIKEWDDKVREIGKFLNMEFDQEYADKQEGSWNYWSQLKNGNKAVSFHVGDYKFKDRWMIHAVFPRDDKGQLNTAYNVKCPEMTVSMAKTAEQIAKNIKSRLIPEYERQLAEVLIKIEKSNKHHAGKLAQITRVAQYLGIDPPTDDNRASIFPGYEKGVHKIEAYSEKTVRFDVEASAEDTIKILKSLGY